MPIPLIYRRSSEAGVNYDYQDIAEGTGYIKYNGLNTGTSGAAVYILSSQDIYSHDVETSPAATITFNLTAFNLPRVVKGIVVVRFSAIGGAGGGSTYYTILFQKVSGATITTLGTAVSPTLTILAIRNITLHCSIAETMFKKGDILRITFTPTGQGGTYFGHDPGNRNGSNVTPATSYPTKFEVYIPFKLDL